uniref:Putative reverse transcriptase domain-containing protein n=1 Tax=Tanacetum cinerariifolium TaxID=118510 RepID=A0A6L2M4N3_TANCI|nr:putative reverse transcriptase domain-containing protein [Tanacetum cinerariifolium]
MADANLHVPSEEVKIGDKLHFVEEAMEIMDCEVKKLKKRRIPIVKVRWNSRRGPEVTWEREDEMKRKFNGGGGGCGFMIATGKRGGKEGQWTGPFPNQNKPRYNQQYKWRSINKRALHKREYDIRVTERLMLSKEGKVESNETESERHVSSSRFGKDTHDEDADINSVNDKQPMAEVQLTAEHNILTNDQQHYEQSESIYDTYLLEKIDRNTTPDSTDMSHKGGEIHQNAVKFQNVAQLQKDFSRMETHSVTMELKYQNQDLKSRQYGQILNETSNEANIKREIIVLETRKFDLESSVARLLAENEKLNKEITHLNQTYKDLSDSIKKTSVQTKDHADSLIVQLNCKSVENADLKAQIQEKVFANAVLKNELRKIKGTSMDTRLAKSSTLRKPILQPHRQPTVFKSERPRFLKPRFASQVDVQYDFPKSVTPHFLPIVRDHVLEKPQHLIAPSLSRNSSKESYASNDMTRKYYLEKAKKKTQERDRKSTTSVMPFAKSQNTTKSCKSKPRGNNQTSRVLSTSKSSCAMTTAMPKAYHSRKSKVNSRAKVQSFKTRNNNKPVKPTSHTQKPSRQIVIGNRFSPIKSFDVHEKINTPRSCLRWIPTGRIFNTAGLRWVSIGKKFTSNTTKVYCEPLNGSNEDTTNPYECNQTLNVSVGTLNLNASTSYNPKKEDSNSEPTLHEMTPATISSGLMPISHLSTSFVPPSRTDWDLLFQPLFNELLTPPLSVDHSAPEVVALLAEVIAPEPAASTGLPSSTTVYQDTPSPSNSQTTHETQTLVISNDVKENNHDLDVAHMNNDPFFGVKESPKTLTFHYDLLHEDSTSQGSSSNMR